MRVVAFATGNASGQGDYYDGLAPKIANSCAANDDLAFPLGDPREASVRAAIDFLAGNACTTRIADASRSEEHTSELQSLMRISYAVFCLKKKKVHQQIYENTITINTDNQEQTRTILEDTD